MTRHLNRTPVKLHLLIGKMQLFCSEEEDALQGRQTTSQRLAINHMSTLGQRRDVPREKFTVICKPWQPTEKERTRRQRCDHITRACSAHVSWTESSQQLAWGPCGSGPSPRPRARLSAAPLGCRMTPAIVTLSSTNTKRRQ